MRAIFNSILALLLLATPALAEPATHDDHPLVPKSEASQLAHTERWDAGMLDHAVSFELFLPAMAWVDYRLSGAPEQYRLPEQMPEVIFLSVTPTPICTLYVTADLDDGLPRLDAVDGDTFFTTGVELHVTRELSLFAEDFQPSSMVLGDDPAMPIPLRSWDGHQAAVGARWSPTGRVTFVAQTVFYLLSASRRPSDVGGTVSVSVRF